MSFSLGNFLQDPFPLSGSPEAVGSRGLCSCVMTQAPAMTTRLFEPGAQPFRQIPKSCQVPLELTGKLEKAETHF